MRDFVKRGGVLVAPSLTRGLDLPDDLCRVVIIIKAPFPYLGDPQVNKRLHRDQGGSLWYDIQTAREVAQMTGRAVRHDTDWAVTYILDATFVKNIWRRRKSLFPKYIRDAVMLASALQVLNAELELPTPNKVRQTV